MSRVSVETMTRQVTVSEDLVVVKLTTAEARVVTTLLSVVNSAKSSEGLSTYELLQELRTVVPYDSRYSVLDSISAVHQLHVVFKDDDE